MRRTMILQSLSVITFLILASATNVAGGSDLSSQLASFSEQEQALSRAIEEAHQSVNLLAPGRSATISWTVYRRGC